jgi:hypothetical protein
MDDPEGAKIRIASDLARGLLIISIGFSMQPI